MIESAEQHTDLAIIGSGPVGLTLALALYDSPYRLSLIDRRPANAWENDPRALALSYGARQVLQQLGAWPEAEATPIHNIHISQRQGFGRSELDRDTYQLPALGYVVPYPALMRALTAALARKEAAATAQTPRLHYCYDYQITQQDNQVNQADQITVHLQANNGGNELRLQAKIVVHAEGTPYDDPQVEVSDYGQWAVVTEVGLAPYTLQRLGQANVQTSRQIPHGYRAWERFTPDGPLALLPLKDGYSVVFTLPPEKAKAVLALNDVDFLAALQQQFGSRLRFTRTAARHAFPLALRWRKQLTNKQNGREVWIGNTAQTLHPVSGQGFNLGLRDAWELAEAVWNSPSPADLPKALQTYAKGRCVDRQGSALFTDKVVRLFSNNSSLLHHARGLGLFALDLIPPARHLVAKRMIWGARAWP